MCVLPNYVMCGILTHRGAEFDTCWTRVPVAVGHLASRVPPPVHVMNGLAVWNVPQHDACMIISGVRLLFHMWFVRLYSPRISWRISLRSGQSVLAL